MHTWREPKIRMPLADEGRKIGEKESNYIVSLPTIIVCDK